MTMLSDPSRAEARGVNTGEEKSGPPTIRGMIALPPQGHYDWMCPNFFIFPRVSWSRARATDGSTLWGCSARNAVIGQSNQRCTTSSTIHLMKTGASFAAEVPRTSSACADDSSRGSRGHGCARRKVRRKIAARARAIFKLISPPTASCASSSWSLQPPLPRGSQIRKKSAI